MSFAYISKRKRIDKEVSEMVPGSDRTFQNNLLIWENFDIFIKKNIVRSCACQLSWSLDGTYLALGTVKGLLMLVYFPKKVDGMMVMQVKAISSIPRCIRWLNDGCLYIAAHNGSFYNFKIFAQSISEDCVENMSEFYTCAFWNENIIYGNKHIYLISNCKIIKTFGPGENLTSCMIVVDDTLFVAYDYSQNSSSDKSIIAFSLPSCAPVSNQLTECLFSYSHLCYSAPYIYGLTSDGKITRFYAKAPFKPDKNFLINLSIPHGFKIQFDIKSNLLAYGDDNGKLIMKKIVISNGSRNTATDKSYKQPESLAKGNIVLKDFCDSSDPIVNVKFHPRLNYVAFSRWKGGFGIVPYNSF